MCIAVLLIKAFWNYSDGDVVFIREATYLRFRVTVSEICTIHFDTGRLITARSCIKIYIVLETNKVSMNGDSLCVN